LTLTSCDTQTREGGARKTFLLTSLEHTLSPEEPGVTNELVERGLLYHGQRHGEILLEGIGRTVRTDAS
jgi:hypothetical protein